MESSTATFSQHGAPNISGSVPHSATPAVPQARSYGCDTLMLGSMSKYPGRRVPGRSQGTHALSNQATLLIPRRITPGRFVDEAGARIQLPPRYELVRPLPAVADIGEGMRHSLTRAAFLRELATDELTRGIVVAGAEHCGLATLTLQLREELGRLGPIPEVSTNRPREGWQDPLRDLDLISLRARVFDHPASDTVMQVQSLGRRLIEAVTSDTERAVWRTGFQIMVEGLELPFPWLADDLVDVMLLAFWGWGWRVDWDFRYRLPPSSPMVDDPAPVQMFHFEPRAGESRGEAGSRFQSEAEAYARRLAWAPRPLPRGRQPRKLQTTIERNARFYYWNKVLHGSLRDIAQFEFGDRERHKDVREGVRQAEQLLLLGSPRS
jgi:hypothetical protein